MRDSTRLAAVRQNPLWDFALAFYARPGMADHLLLLQDEAGMDVCVLLWRLWLDHLGLEPTHQAERGLAEIYAWQSDYTRPLRARRRRLKPAAAHDPALAELRQALKTAELLAERQALYRLEALACRPGSTIPAANASGVLAALAPFSPGSRPHRALVALHFCPGRLNLESR